MVKKKKRNKRQWTPKQKWEVLYYHNEKCYYCDQPLTLESMVMEHFVPYTVTESNAIAGIVPSCTFCNAIKGTKEFANREEARDYIQRERIYGDFTRMPKLRDNFQLKTKVEQVLLFTLPDGSMVVEEQTEKCYDQPRDSYATRDEKAITLTEAEAREFGLL